jgi:hypothetical protein
MDVSKLNRLDYDDGVIYDSSDGSPITPDEADELLRLAKAGQQIQWIPVERKLPQNDQLVLVAKGPWFNLRTFCIDVDGDTYWFDYIHGERFELDEYPHWMSLPEPPSESDRPEEEEP